MSEAAGILVGGEWRGSASGRTDEKRSPWRPDVVTGTFAAANADDAAAAVAAAGDWWPRLLPIKVARLR